VVFSSPAIVTDNLATAFAQSELLVNVIYGNDIVPRISRRNMATLAKEIIEFGDSHLSAEWAKVKYSFFEAMSYFLYDTGMLIFRRTEVTWRAISQTWEKLLP